MGYFATRAKLEDFATARVRQCTLGKDGVMDKQCALRNAFYFASERAPQALSMCCRMGKLKFVSPLPPAPEPLARLLAGKGADTVAFKENVWRYNGALAFASFNDARSAKPPCKAPQSRLPPRGGNCERRAK